MTVSREYWSRRLKHAGGWGNWWKDLTHRKERREKRNIEREFISKIRCDDCGEFDEDCNCQI